MLHAHIKVFTASDEVAEKVASAGRRDPAITVAGIPRGELSPKR